MQLFSTCAFSDGLQFNIFNHPPSLPNSQHQRPILPKCRAVKAAFQDASINNTLLTSDSGSIGNEQKNASTNDVESLKENVKDDSRKLTELEQLNMLCDDDYDCNFDCENNIHTKVMENQQKSLNDNSDTFRDGEFLYLRSFFDSDEDEW